MLSSIGRAALRRVGAESSHRSTNRVLQSTWHLQSVDKSNNTYSSSHLRQLSFFQRKSYATATQTTKPKPKTSTKAKAKPKTKKVAPKKNTVKKKVLAKSKPGPKPKKKVLTEKQRENAELKALKATALTPPKGKPASAWIVLFSEYMAEHSKGTSSASSLAKDAATKYKSLTVEELEKFNHTANQNKIANESAYKKWIESHTPEQIRLANNARNSLKKKRGVKGSSKWPLLVDPRLPKRPSQAWILFAKDRWNSGDLKGIKVVDGSAQIVKEWKELSPSQRKTYEDLSAAQTLRYTQEFKNVFGRDPELIKRQQTAG